MSYKYRLHGLLRDKSKLLIKSKPRVALMKVWLRRRSSIELSRTDMILRCRLLQMYQLKRSVTLH